MADKDMGVAALPDVLDEERRVILGKSLKESGDVSLDPRGRRENGEGRTEKGERRRENGERRTHATPCGSGKNPYSMHTFS